VLARGNRRQDWKSEAYGQPKKEPGWADFICFKPSPSRMRAMLCYPNRLSSRFQLYYVLCR